MRDTKFTRTSSPGHQTFVEPVHNTGMISAEILRAERLFHHLRSVPDPRVEGRCRHKLIDIFVIAFSAILCGAESCTEIEDYGKAKHDWLKQFLELPNGIPSHDTFLRVLSLVDPKELERAFVVWAVEVHNQLLKHVAIDGKAIAGTSHDAHIRHLHVVNVYSVDGGMVLGQFKATSSGFGEITGLKDALGFFNLKGTLITADAAHSFPTVASAIREAGADYLLPSKSQKRPWQKTVAEAFSKGRLTDQAETNEKSHGRIDERKCEVLSVSQLCAAEKLSLQQWPGLKTLARIERTRVVPRKNVMNQKRDDQGKFYYELNTKSEARSNHVVYYISSRDQDALSVLQHVRAHWTIEDQLHWSLDVAFHEDDWHIREKNAARNMSAIRKMAYNIVSKHPAKMSRRVKMKTAGWNNSFYEDLIFHRLVQ